MRTGILAGSGFQFTPPRGRRLLSDTQLYPQYHFNSRLHEGGDSDDTNFEESVKNFNSRLHEGGDIFFRLLL